MITEARYQLWRKLPYEEAWLYCVCLFEDGYSDWRMPASNYDVKRLTAETWVDTNPNFKSKVSIFNIIPIRGEYHA